MSPETRDVAHILFSDQQSPPEVVADLATVFERIDDDRAFDAAWRARVTAGSAWPLAAFRRVARVAGYRVAVAAAGALAASLVATILMLPPVTPESSGFADRRPDTVAALSGIPAERLEPRLRAALVSFGRSPDDRNRETLSRAAAESGFSPEETRRIITRMIHRRSFEAMPPDIEDAATDSEAKP